MTSSYDVSLRHPAFKIKLLLAVTFLCLGCSLPFFVAAPARAASATLSVTTKQVNLGNTFAISGSGFASGEKIAVWVTSPAGKAFDGLSQCQQTR